MTDYTTLSLAQVAEELTGIAREAEDVFGRLDERRLNWKPDPARWSVAQCFQHLMTSNQLMLDGATAALSRPPASIRQRIPVLPRLLGPALIKSQAPGGSRRYVAPAKAQPSRSDLPPDVIARFARQQRDLAEWTSHLDPSAAGRAIMPSPFVRVISYSVLDGSRLMVAHNRRHFEQARHVTEAVSFPVQR